LGDGLRNFFPSKNILLSEMGVASDVGTGTDEQAVNMIGKHEISSFFIAFGENIYKLNAV